NFTTNGSTATFDYTLTVRKAPTFSVSDLVVQALDTTATTAHFAIKLARAADRDTTFAYHTEDVTPLAGSTYIGGSGQITIHAGSDTAFVNVAVNKATVATSSFRLVVDETSNNTSNAEVAATATIVSDNGAQTTRVLPVGGSVSGAIDYKNVDGSL